jgi:hypothetical protein
MGDFEQRPKLLGHGVPLVGVGAIAAFNGTLFSPIFDSVSYYVDTFARGTLFYSPELYQHVTSVFMALMTLLIAGIPAALYERTRGLKMSTLTSLGIWFVAAVLLSLPTILNLLGGDDF